MTTADGSIASGDSGRRKLNLAPLQKFGRSLMLPIAALPAAALLLRLGQPDLLGADGLGWTRVAPVIGAAGGALFDNLPILFAVGIAIGMAKKADGSTALAAVVGYLVFKGDIARFLNGDPTAGAFMTGFFPIMMFALPAAALAIYQEAKPAQKKLVGGIMGSAALTSFLTGVTEPLEFAFMFVAWPLYVIHAVLTGTSLALTNALGIKDGFGFSAGLFDFVLNYNIATKPLLLVLIGLGYAVVYYVLFRFVIRKWNLRTPGREDEGEESLVTADDSA